MNNSIYSSVYSKLRISIVTSLLLFATTATAAETTFTFIPAHGKVTFAATGRPKAIKIHGEGTGADGVLTQTGTAVHGTLTFDLGTLTTGIALRDKHMKDKYLDVAKFPKADLSINELTLPKVTALKDFKDLPFKGLLKLKGVEKSVEGTANLTTSKAPNVFDVSATFPLKLTDFKIDIPTHLGITVAEDVQVSVESNVESKPSSGGTP